MSVCNHKEELISRLESILNQSIYNNGNRISYPIVFSDGSALKKRGKGVRLKTDNMNVNKFYSGHYQFGANSFYVYKAIRDILNELDRLKMIPEGWEEEAFWLYNPEAKE